MSSKGIKRRAAEAAALGFFGICAVLPVVWSIAYAAAYSVGLAGLLARGLTMEHWRVVLATRGTGVSFAVSIYVALAALILTVTFAMFFSLTLRARLARGVLGYLVYFPLALPGTVAALLAFQVLSGAGLLSRVAHALGWVATPAEFPGLIYDPWGIGIICTHVALAVPFFTLIFSGIYEREKVERLNALAATLGAARVARTLRVTVPLLLDRASTNLALFFMAVMSSFEIPLLLGPQSPQMISVLARRKFGLFDLTEKPQAFIIALLYTGLVVVLLLIFLRRRPGASTL